MKKVILFFLFLFSIQFAKAQINWQVSNQFNQYWGIDGNNAQQICNGPLYDTLDNYLTLRIFAEKGAICQHIYRRSSLINDSIYIDLEEDWASGCALAEDVVCFKLKICPLDSLTLGRTIHVNYGSYANPLTSSWMNVKRLGNTIIYNNFAVLVSNFHLNIAKNSNYTQLNWTADVLSSKQFLVEKSIDGNIFYSIGSVATSPSPKMYSYMDKDKSKNCFYRIKHIDADGKFTYSNTEYVNNDFQKLGISVVENPLNNNRINIHFEGQKDENYKIKIVDILGNVIYKNTLIISSDDYYYNQVIQSNSSKFLIVQLENQATNINTFFKLIAQ